MQLSDFRALSFDCYGTLIDWETGISAVLGPWARAHNLDVDEDRLLAAVRVTENSLRQSSHFRVIYDIDMTREMRI
jgi:putative hydrolase of the HAD superfamily